MPSTSGTVTKQFTLTNHNTLQTTIQPSPVTTITAGSTTNQIIQQPSIKPIAVVSDIEKLFLEFKKSTDDRLIKLEQEKELEKKQSDEYRNRLEKVEREILLEKKQTNELHKQLEFSQRQLEDYKIRLEKLERESDFDNDERFRQYTNSQ